MGKFIIEKGSDDYYYFTLSSSSGEIIFTSEKYFFKAACKIGIDTVRANATNYLRYDLGTTHEGKYYFKLRGSNGHLIGKSGVYESVERRNTFVEIVKRATPYAKVIDLTRQHELRSA
jgi:uncharacterized protein